MRPSLKKIKAGKKCITALILPLQSKNLIVLRGRKGYIMCGYLNMDVAEKFNDIAVKISGASTIKEALNANVYSCTSKAKEVGINEGQPVKDILNLIA